MELSTVDLGMDMVLEGGMVRDAVVGGEGDGKSNFIVSISPSRRHLIGPPGVFN